jgi:hypothetical protein
MFKLSQKIDIGEIYVYTINIGIYLLLYEKNN